MLSKELAQEVVDKMMGVIPYNVNIMDRDGIIIGSGHYERIGEIHFGAIEALENKKIVKVYESINGVKPGVNIPIIFKENIIGVIGITGNPNDVSQFGKLVSVTAELLINQEYTLNKYVIKQKLKEEFIYEWIYCKDNYNNEFIRRGMSLGIDITIDRIVIVLQYEKRCSKEVNNLIKQNEYKVSLATNRVALILENDSNLDWRIRNIEGKNGCELVKVGVGNVHKTVLYSLIEALESLEIGIKLYGNSFCTPYNKIKIFNNMSDIFNNKECENIILKISNDGKDEELLDSFLIYMRMNGEKQSVANEMHIHRNTLHYRLEKIEKLTGLKFDNYLDFFQLLSAYISYKIR
ncbi:MAG: sugar diacid recognition domain-containing protein [Clostridium sp.]